MDDLNSLLERKKQFEKLILKGRRDLFKEYNEVYLKILKIRYLIHFNWPENGHDKKGK